MVVTLLINDFFLIVLPIIKVLKSGMDLEGGLNQVVDLWSSESGDYPRSQLPIDCLVFELAKLKDH